jgi:hypothetical protein
MIYFSQIDENSIVTNVTVIDPSDCKDSNNNISEEVGANFLANLLGGTWIMTERETGFRKQFGDQGFTYDEANNVFISVKPYPSWTLNNTSFDWESPVPHPTDGKLYDWDETTLSWVE